MSARSVAVEAHGLSVELGGRTVLSDLTFEARSHCLTAIIGPNGSGKTTLLRALAGLIGFRGQVLHGSTRLDRLSRVERSQVFAYLPQQTELRSMLSVREVVRLARSCRRSWWQAEPESQFVDEALARVGLSALADRPYPHLSGGQQRRALLARALASGCRTLLLDEPTAALDLHNSLLLFSTLRELVGEGYCVVCVLHDLDDVMRHSGYAYLLDDGRLRFAGNPQQPAFLDTAARVYRVKFEPASRLGYQLDRQAP